MLERAAHENNLKPEQVKFVCYSDGLAQIVDISQIEERVIIDISSPSGN